MPQSDLPDHLAQAALEDRSKALATIRAFTDNLYRHDDFPTAAAKAVDVLLAYLPAEAAALFLLADDGHSMEMVWGHGFSNESRNVGTKLPLHGSLTGQAIIEKAIIDGADLHQDRRFEPRVRRTLLAQGLRGAVSVPLLYNGAANGALNLLAPEVRLLNDVERETLLTISKVLGMALANATNIAQLQDAEDARAKTEARLAQFRDHLQDLVSVRTAALRESEERYRRLVEASPAAFMVISDERFAYLNPAAADLLGADSATTLLNRAVYDIMHPNHRRDIRSALNDLLSTPRATDFAPLSLVLRSGRALVLEVAAAPVVYRDEPGTLLIARDITIRHRAQEERSRLIEDLESYGHTVAHNLRNPLNIISSYAELIVRDHPDLEQAELVQYADAIGKTAFKMSQILGELLLFSQLRQIDDIELTPLDMGSVVEDACQRVFHLADEYGADIRVPAEWPAAFGYAPWVEEVWANYLGNALKYGGEPPVVELGADVLEDGMVRFWVQDNGPGVSAEEQAELFLPPARLRRKPIRGIGLGLSLVRRIVQRLGGDVACHSAPGQGARFSFTLPDATGSPRRRHGA